MKDATTIHFDMGKFADGGSCRPWGQHNHLDLMAVVVPFRLQELAGIRDSNLKRQPRNWGGTNSFPSRSVGTTYRDPKNTNRSSGDWILQDDDVSLGATWAAVFLFYVQRCCR